MYLQRQMATILAAVLATIIVIDGDTVRMDGKRYRLLGFDSPETFFAKCGREREAGSAAAARLKELIETTDARLEPTGRNCKWGRGCAYLLLNGEDAGDVMIREGHGAPYTGGKRPNWCGS